MQELLPIIAVMALLLGVLIAFIREWAPAEVIAMSAFCLLVFSGILSPDHAFAVFSNQAPMTIAAMFIMSGALEKSGVIDQLGHILNKVIGNSVWLAIPPIMLIVVICSAFINNTPVVAIFLPILLGLSRRKHLPASKLLLPLSYAAVLGGSCTLIGTSTNILVAGIAVEYGQEPLKMFEFAPLGLICAAVGLVYVAFLGPLFLPDRAGVMALLSPKDRQQFLCHLLIKPDSDLVGQRLLATPLGKEGEGFRIVEVRRNGSRSDLALDEIVVRSFDRVLVAVSSRHMEKGSDKKSTLRAELKEELGIENLSTIKGAIIEGIIAPHSKLINQSLNSVKFRQAYGMLALAIHRKGRNLDKGFHDIPLEFGDTILLLGPVSTFDRMREEGDFIMLEDQKPKQTDPFHRRITLLSLAGVVVAATLNVVPIVFAAIVGCLVVLWCRCLSPREAYQSIDWSIMFLLYGMLALGSAMEVTGAAQWLARGVVEFGNQFIPEVWLPMAILALIYIMGSFLTEILSNNATAVIMAPIAINSAISLDLDPRPFIIAVAFSCSLAFSSPLGYQTHMMVYGPGGYRFADFVKFGLPLNIILWLVASYFIPIFWPF